MRYCPECRRINEGFPERCRYCGSTWGTRFCRRGHPNPSDAAFCGECGSADLSTTAHGGGVINAVLGIGRHRRLIWFIIRISVPLFMLILISKDPARYLPLLLPIFLLIIAFRFALGIIPLWLFKPALKILKPNSKKKIRARKRERREV